MHIFGAYVGCSDSDATCSDCRNNCYFLLQFSVLEQLSTYAIPSVSGESEADSVLVFLIPLYMRQRAFGLIRRKFAIFSAKDIDHQTYTNTMLRSYIFTIMTDALSNMGASNVLQIQLAACFRSHIKQFKAVSVDVEIKHLCSLHSTDTRFIIFITIGNRAASYIFCIKACFHCQLALTLFNS